MNPLLTALHAAHEHAARQHLTLAASAWRAATAHRADPGTARVWPRPIAPGWWHGLRRGALADEPVSVAPGGVARQSCA